MRWKGGVGDGRLAQVPSPPRSESTTLGWKPTAPPVRWALPLLHLLVYTAYLQLNCAAFFI